MLSVAECLHISEPGGPSKETRELFEEVLTSGTVVHLVDPDIFVAERARELLWNDGFLLSGADCLHVATALLGTCAAFLTLDAKIKKQGKFMTAIPQLERIGLTVLRPSQTTQLLIEYRSDDIFTDRGEAGTPQQAG